MNSEPIGTDQFWMSEFRRGALALGLWRSVNCVTAGNTGQSLSLTELPAGCSCILPDGRCAGGWASILVLGLAVWLGCTSPFPGQPGAAAQSPRLQLCCDRDTELLPRAPRQHSTRMSDFSTWLLPISAEKV